MPDLCEPWGTLTSSITLWLDLGLQRWYTLHMGTELKGSPQDPSWKPVFLSTIHLF